MLTMEETYKTIKELEQGTQFTYKGKLMLKLPPYVECYGNPCNAVEIRTGTMVDVKDTMLCDMNTLIASEEYWI